MENKKKEELIREALKEQNVFTLKSVDNVNHQPHPYMIGPRHIEHASDNHSGMLGEETCKAIRCATPGCNVAYEEHTSDNVCFLQLLRDANHDEVSKVLQDLVADLPKNIVDGFAFVETKQEYRIAE